MLIFNPRRMFGLRGIERPNNFLVRNGFTAMIASRLLAAGLANVKVSNVGRLCELLNCTPNDLFEWRHPANTSLPENHALKALIRQEARPLADLLKDVPAEKLADLQLMIDELSKK